MPEGTGTVLALNTILDTCPVLPVLCVHAAVSKVCTPACCSGCTRMQAADVLWLVKSSCKPVFARTQTLDRAQMQAMRATSVDHYSISIYLYSTTSAKSF